MTFLLVTFRKRKSMPPRNSGSLFSFGILSGVFQNGSSPQREIFAEAETFHQNDNIRLIENKNLEYIMSASHVGSQIAGSRAVTVARTFVHDWMILVLLMSIEFTLHVIHPFYRFVGKDMMIDLKYPHKSDTVPFWAVPMLTILLPIAIFVVIYVRRREIYDLHHAVLGLLYSVLVTAVITNAIKNAVGRPRPDFFWRCFPDGKDVYDALGNVVCHGERHLLDEGHKSFPSGHTSWSFAGLGFLSLYLAGKIKAFDQRGHVAKLCIVFLPLLVACLVGISRVDDYRHHWQDVFAGGLLGMIMATFCYLQFFPPPNHSEGFFPYDCIHDLEARGGTQAVGASHSSNGQVVETQTENEQHTINGNGCVGISIFRPSHPPADLEQHDSGGRSNDSDSGMCRGLMIQIQG